MPGFDANGRLLEPANGLQRTMAMLAIPLAIAVPVWFGLGRVILIQEAGWATIMLVGLSMVVAVVMVVHAVLTMIRAGKVRPFAAGIRSSWAALAVGVIVFLLPFFIEDFGDQGPASPAPVSRWFGLSSEVSGPISGLLLLLGIAAIVVMIVLDIVDLMVTRRAIDERRAAHFQQMAGPRPPMR